MTKALRYSYPGCTDRYDIATCTDGKWHVRVHGKDRLLEYDCELRENEYGQYLEFGGGSILPLTDKNGKLFSRWSEVSDNVNDNPEPLTLNPEPELNHEPELNPEPELGLTLNSQIEEVVTIREGAGRRKRTRRSKSQKGLEDNNSSLFTLHSSFEEDNLLFNSEDTEPEGGKDRNILKAVGGMAAMTLALVVIWETGLLIPLGILGLITAGILK